MRKRKRKEKTDPRLEGLFKFLKKIHLCLKKRCGTETFVKNARLILDQDMREYATGVQEKIPFLVDFFDTLINKEKAGPEKVNCIPTIPDHLKGEFDDWSKLFQSKLREFIQGLLDGDETIWCFFSRRLHMTCGDLYNLSQGGKAATMLCKIEQLSPLKGALLLDTQVFNTRCHDGSHLLIQADDQARIKQEMRAFSSEKGINLAENDEYYILAILVFVKIIPQKKLF